MSGTDDVTLGWTVKASQVVARSPLGDVEVAVNQINASKQGEDSRTQGDRATK